MDVFKKKSNLIPSVFLLCFTGALSVAETGNQSDVSGHIAQVPKPNSSSNPNSKILRSAVEFSDRVNVVQKFYGVDNRQALSMSLAPEASPPGRKEAANKLITSLEQLNQAKASTKQNAQLREVFAAYNDYIETLNKEDLAEPPPALVVLRNVLGGLVTPSKYPLSAMIKFFYSDPKKRESLRLSLSKGNPANPAATVELSQIINNLAKGETVSPRKVRRVFNNFVLSANNEFLSSPPPDFKILYQILLDLTQKRR